MRKRVALVGARGISNYGGFETFVAELAPRLTALKYEVFVSSRRSDAAATSRSLNEVHILHFPLRFPRRSSLGRLFEVLYDWYFVVLCSFVLRCEIVYCLGIASGPVLPLARLAGAETVLNVDGLEWRRPKFGALEKAYIRFAFLTSYIFSDRLVIDNGQLVNFVPEAAKNKSVIIPYGVTPCECHQLNLEAVGGLGDKRMSTLESGKYWLVVARLEPDNMIHLVVEGYARSRSKMPLVVVGDFSSDRYRSRVLGLIDSLGVGARVIMLGSVYNRDVLVMLRCNCAAYVHGHSVGGTNPSLLEAMGCGNIIIAHDNPFNREVCGEHALFFGDSDTLASEISLVESDRSSYAGKGEKAKERALRNYRWESIAESYDALFRELTGTR